MESHILVIDDACSADEFWSAHCQDGLDNRNRRAEAELHFIDAGEVVEVPVSPADCEAAINQVLDALPSLTGQTSTYPKEEGDACCWCRQRTICRMIDILSS